MTIYPNPVSNQLQISIKVPQMMNQKGALEIRSITGAVIKIVPITVLNSVTKVDVSSLSKGMYTATITINARKISKQFIKL